MRLGERRHQRRRRDEQHRVAGRIASRPSATARWVLPTPGGPSSSSVSPLAMNRPVAEIADLLRVERGLGLEVEAGEVAHEGELRDRIAISIRRSSLRAISRSQNKASASRSVSSRRAASSSRLSSWSRIAVSLSRVSIRSRCSCSAIITSLLRPTASYSASGRNSAGGRAGGGSAGAGAHGSSRAPAMPSKWAGSSTRCRRPLRSACTATSRPACRMRTPPAADLDQHALADQPPRHAVGVAVDLDAAVGLNPADQLADLPERRPAGERLQRRGLVPLGTARSAARPSCRGPEVGDLPRPPLEMRLERRPAREACARRSRCSSRSRRRARPCPWSAPGRARRPAAGTPSAGRRQQPGVEADLAGRPLVVHRPAPGRCRAAPPPAPRRRAGTPPPSPRTRPPAARAGTPARAAGASSRASPRTGSTRTLSPPITHPRLAEVDLQLPAGRRLEAHRRPRLGRAAPGAAAPPRARPCAGSPRSRARAAAPGAPRRRCRDAAGTAPPASPPARPAPAAPRRRGSAQPPCPR